ncbi:MAG TPA: hypothetical protein VM096_11295 [Vicinamibacterales bacterium]|nr:hypothetical protein [Vicinamibacterales bacterium]
MKKLFISGTIAKTLLYMLLTAACTRAEAVDNIPAGTDVTVVTQDGTLVRGKIASVEADRITLIGERPNTSTEIARTSIREVKRVASDYREPASDAPGARIAEAPNARVADAPTAPIADAPSARVADEPRSRITEAPRVRNAEAKASSPIVRNITIPDNTVINVTLGTALASDTSRVEQPVRGTVSSPVVVDGATVIPSGASLSGHVTNVDGSGKVKGRAALSFRFTRLTTGSASYDIDTKPVAFVAESTKKDDAVKIGAGAAAGAVIGAIAGGKKGAAIGTAVGAGAGTGVVLATDGKEIRLAEGRKLKVSLNNPLTIRTK